MTTQSIALPVVALLMAIAPFVGCSESSTTQASLGSSSDSSSSPFKWSSSSSGGEESDEDTAYRRDVRDYAASFAPAGVDTQVFQRELSAIAEQHGVTDWESHESTYLAIGSGLGQTDLEANQFADIAVELARKDHRRLALMQAGFYESREADDHP